MSASYSDQPQVDLSIYRQSMLRQQQQRDDACAARFQHAWAVAKQASQHLKHGYGIKHVWLFGSLLNQPWFTLSSDIDLAVEHVSPDQYLTALANLQDISPKFKIDLVQLDKCPHYLRDKILSEGQLL